MMTTFAERLPHNPALPARRQTFARVALGATFYPITDMSLAEWAQSQRDADYLLCSHGYRAARVRWLVCPPLPLTHEDP